MYGKIEFKDKTTLITGAARGIGKEIAWAFANTGSNLILCDLDSNKELLLNVEREIKEKYSVECRIFAIDIRNVNNIEKVAKEILNLGIMVDILINNAGVNSYLSPFEITEKEWDMVMDTNLKGTFYMSKIIAEYFLIKQKGNIVSIASQHGVVANYDRVHYCSSKAGIIHMTKALALEWSKFNVRVNCISPTFVETDENKSLLEQIAFKRDSLKKIPLKKYAKPQDIANAAIFLASSMSEMITGHNLIVDGGWTIC